MNLYIDTIRKESVIGQTNPLAAPFPPLVQGSTVPMRIYLMDSFTGSSYSYIPVAGTTLEVALGRKRGNGGGTYYTQQFTWTPSSDLAQPFFEADFPMNTSGVDNALGSAASVFAYLEIKKITAGIPDTVLVKKVKIEATVIHDNVLVTPVGLTPTSAEAVAAGFVPRIGFNGELEFINETTGKGFAIYADADGAMQVRQIIPP